MSPMNNRLMVPTARRINLDAADWVSRVVDNGGTVSPATAAAVSTLCNAIDAAGIRDRFYRLNLFCGDNLAAALVPLYRGQSLGGTQYGNTTDTNNGPFVSGDYTTTLGLIGNGTNKYLDTGVAASVMTESSNHLAFSVSGASDGRVPIGSDTFGGAQSPRTLYFMQDYAGASMVFYPGSFASPAGARGNPALVLGTRSATVTKLYSDGAEVGTITLAQSITTGVPLTFFVFANNINGSASTFYTRTIRSYSIGLGMTATQAASYNTAIQALETAIGRP